MFHLKVQYTGLFVLKILHFYAYDRVLRKFDLENVTLKIVNHHHQICFCWKAAIPDSWVWGTICNILFDFNLSSPMHDRSQRQVRYIILIKLTSGSLTTLGLHQFQLSLYNWKKDRFWRQKLNQILYWQIIDDYSKNLVYKVGFDLCAMYDINFGNTNLNKLPTFVGCQNVNSMTRHWLAIKDLGSRDQPIAVDGELPVGVCYSIYGIPVSDLMNSKLLVNNKKTCRIITTRRKTVLRTSIDWNCEQIYVSRSQI